ncbi:MAG: hypothetical protein CBC12_07230 [Candidatus Puniceispirillum sp. TMED52]|nr:MAG: hypothetical protein CBC12_07230 [Candidatus Puniceispirillum sp. TMED52]
MEEELPTPLPFTTPVHLRHIKSSEQKPIVPNALATMTNSILRSEIFEGVLGGGGGEGGGGEGGGLRGGVEGGGFLGGKEGGGGADGGGGGEGGVKGGR